MLISAEHGSTRSQKQEVTADIPTCRVHLSKCFTYRLAFRLRCEYHFKHCLCMFTDQEQKQCSLGELHPLVETLRITCYPQVSMLAVCKYFKLISKDNDKFKCIICMLGRCRSFPQKA